MMSFRRNTIETQASRGGPIDSQSGRPTSSGGRAQSAKSANPTGISGGSDALRRVMRQLSRDTMVDKNLAENEEEFIYEDTDSEDGDVDGIEVHEGRTIESAAVTKGHKHLQPNGKYLSCKRYPWICLRANCQHKKEFSGEYKAISDKNTKAVPTDDGMSHDT